MQKALKAIDTPYGGRLYRSRLEARWAVFLDELGVRFDYEPEGFALTTPDGNEIRYLPDFWLPEMECWVEIKPDMQDYEQDRAASVKCQALAMHADRVVYLFAGLEYQTGEGGVADIVPSAQAFFPDGWDDGYHWCECPKCGKIGIEYHGRADRIGCCESGRVVNDDSLGLRAAYTAARSARFEHGAHGKQTA